MRTAGRELAARHGTAFLMKGGHLGGDTALDVLCLPGGETHDFASPFLRGVSTHGTGCTYSAAVAAGLAHANDLPDAIAQAKTYMNAAIGQHYRWGGVTALRHCIEPFP